MDLYDPTPHAKQQGNAIQRIQTLRVKMQTPYKESNRQFIVGWIQSKIICRNPLFKSYR